MKTDDEMKKFAATEVPVILKTAAEQVRKQASTILDLTRERDGLENELRAIKLAQRITERGIDDHLSFEQKVAKVKELDETKLAGLEAVIEAVGGSFSLGRLEEEKVAAQAGGSSQEALTDFILNGDALTR
jgi:hypothetical protein